MWTAIGLCFAPMAERVLVLRRVAAPAPQNRDPVAPQDRDPVSV